MLRDSIPGIDQIMDGDEPDGSIILVLGSPGSLKSTFMFTALSNYIKGGDKRGIYITLEQSKDRHILNLTSMGFDKPDSLDIIDYNYTRKLANIQGKEGLEFQWVIDSMSKYTEEIGGGFSCLAIDSLNALYTLIDTIKDRNELYFFFEKLRALKATILIAGEIVHGLRVENMLLGSEEFLCDGIIELGTIDVDNKVKRYIQMKKMRAVRHKIDKFSIEVISGEGVKVLGELII